MKLLHLILFVSLYVSTGIFGHSPEKESAETSLFSIGVLDSGDNGKHDSGNYITSGFSDTGTRIYFKDLRKYRMGDPQPPEEIGKLNGKTVTIVGYMVPFDSIENIEKFVLLQAPFMGCYHVPPPQPNETLMIYSSSQRVDYTYEPVLVTGTLEVEESYVEAYLVSKYTIHAVNVRRADMKDAELEGLPLDFHFGGDF
ncbi:MAG: DUF3299 domain-containing protein [Balneolaceae bacterium]|nr:MAG: DUF3299 domain-containing protein [Balneolaceae bacterium]